MKLIPIGRLLIGILLFGVWSCATTPRTVNPYFEMPPEHLLKAERELFALALQQQKNNKLESSIELWKRFLTNNPRSFRGYNNLGMAHYTNDQLSPALSAFETGLALEPIDNKIKENLKRTLRFQVTLLRENKDYDAAIQFLKRIHELSEEPEREKVALEIETLEDNIFEQVKRSNTLEDYEVFLARYPNSPKNSDEARRRIARMKPEQSPMGELPIMEGVTGSTPVDPNMGLEPFVPESMETPKSSMPGTVISEDTIEIVAEPKEEMKMADEFPEGAPPMDPPAMEKPTAKETMPKMAEEKTKAEEKPEMKKPSKPKKMAPVKPAKKVKITTKTTPLRVRSDPSSKAEIVAQLPTATIVPMFQETGQWYQIEYLPGKKGWISKKYSKQVN